MGRRVHIEAHDVLDLLGEGGIVGLLEGADAVGLEAMGVPEASYCANESRSSDGEYKAQGTIALNIATASLGLHPAFDASSPAGLRHAASSRTRKSSHRTIESIFTSGAFLASKPAYRLTMSKKTICPIAGSPDRCIMLPRF
jgi:hypothetical protein